MKNRCLCCYKELENDELNYHPGCAAKLFGSRKAPFLPYNRSNIEDLALKIIERSTSITGVQPKIALDINRGGKNEPDKLTIVGLWGNYILKPQSSSYNCMPEVEDLTMSLAEICGIETVKHGLIRMNDGELAYITRRIDRGENGEKRSMLDMCQLSNRLTEHKYMGSYLQLADTIKKYSVSSMLDVQRFWEIVLFSWITGNSDMHCKNFSLLNSNIGYRLSPAYDLISVRLVLDKDHDELAMPLIGAGKMNNEIIEGFSKCNFVEAMVLSGIKESVANKLIHNMTLNKDKWFERIDISFLTPDLKANYKALITERVGKLIP